MKLCSFVVCAALAVALLGCPRPTGGPPAGGGSGEPATYRRTSETKLGYVRLSTGESAIVWKHCRVPLDGVSTIDITLGRNPSTSAVAAVHDTAAPLAAPLAVATASTGRLRLALGAPVRGTRQLTVLEGNISSKQLSRLLAEMREPEACAASAPEGGGIKLPPVPCKPCDPGDCVPCPPPCPDPPCP